MTNDEQWKTISRFPGYEFSSLGRVRSYLATGRGKRKFNSIPIIRQQHLNGKGYLRIRISKEDRTWSTIQTGALILEAFVGYKSSPKLQCCHNNNIRTDNRIDNLRWDTKKGNEADKVKFGTSNRGSNCGKAKLRDFEVIVIKELCRDYKINCSEIARLLDVSVNSVLAIKNGNTWKYI